MDQIRARIGELEDRRAKRIAVFLENLDSDIQEVVNQVSQGRNLSSVPSAIAEIAFLVESLRIAGYENIIGDLQDLYGVEMAEVGRMMSSVSGIDVGFSNADLAIADALVTFEADRIFNKVALNVENSGRIILDAVILGQKPNIKDIAAGSTGLVSNIETEINTGLSAFNRSVTLKKADDVGIELFVYAGRLIKTSRDFCIARAGKVFTRAQIKRWDNGQGLPADIYLGGYNCRHQLIPISQRKAKELGYDGKSRGQASI